MASDYRSLILLLEAGNAMDFLILAKAIWASLAVAAIICAGYELYHAIKDDLNGHD